MASFIVADDVMSWRDRNKAFLTAGGHSVIAEATNGKDALDLARSFRPDCVLLDISMPVLGGDQAARIIIAENLARHVFICSSAAITATAKPLIDLGATFISKPYHRPDFLQEIERVLHG
jgi:two-component system chemotaxis response regulator CheY